ncbi:hypothetical protein EJ06DRAFT_90371 [Trichodelitschia bisporula]|uniref:Uncharacterized protein n=1 Tax=Trichodelitschia bisporula TaxID=703511 RepID=A0A6G1HS57_9PEZI|nr:hypothetical protein EJ06DRAFT_90371 [Trichodelitschia bisporula]
MRQANRWQQRSGVSMRSQEVRDGLRRGVDEGRKVTLHVGAAVSSSRTFEVLQYVLSTETIVWYLVMHFASLSLAVRRHDAIIIGPPQRGRANGSDGRFLVAGPASANCGPAPATGQRSHSPEPAIPTPEIGGASSEVANRERRTRHCQGACNLLTPHSDTSTSRVSSWPCGCEMMGTLGSKR